MVYDSSLNFCIFLQVLSAAADKLSTLTIETTENDNPAIETPLKRHLILGIDPRSPTVGLQRTPIVISPIYPSGIKNKNLEKVKKIDIPGNSSSNTSSPKLLSSNPITPKIVKNDALKRKSFVLLETNIDYTETDLDAVIQEKHSLAIKNEEKLAEDNCVNTSLNENEYDTASEESLSVVKKDAETETKAEISDDLPEVPVVENELQGLLHVHKEDTKNSDNKDVVEITEPLETKIVEPNVDQVETIEEPEVTEKDTAEVTDMKTNKSVEKAVNDSAENNDFVLCTKSAPVSPPNMVCVTPKLTKSEPVTPPVVNLTADIRELDKKLTNLIYEDEDPVVCPRAVKPKNQNRTPLGPKNEDSNRRTKLKVSDKPRKSINPCSKIPVFKEKRIKVQSENIPPTGLRNEKPLKPHWDPKDDTLVI